ncbi:hypothetical protein V1283_008846 [Bradyrhizobium sp. AZCC 2262]|uniref:hypothetical protein n=1 Tax=Bradyrhizobium sp. AZCC 2262 TaxID=3117022 RepID=UPI002FF1E319
MTYEGSSVERPRGTVCPPVQRPPRRSFLDDVAAALRDLGLVNQPIKCPFGRSFNRDFRCAIHEIGHALTIRILGDKIDGVTIDPGPGYEGQVWAPWTFKAFTRGDVDAAQIRAVLEPQMPQAGEDQGPAADVTLKITNQIIQFMGGRAAEKLALRGKSSAAPDDYRQSRELAAIVCKSPKSVERFVQFCEQQAEDLLRPHIDLIFALIPVLRIRRTMTGIEVDEAIAIILAHFDRSAERERRRDWDIRMKSAEIFRGQCISHE